MVQSPGDSEGHWTNLSGAAAKPLNKQEPYLRLTGKQLQPGGSVS